MDKEKIKTVCMGCGLTHIKGDRHLCLIQKYPFIDTEEEKIK